MTRKRTPRYLRKPAAFWVLPCVVMAFLCGVMTTSFGAETLAARQSPSNLPGREEQAFATATEPLFKRFCHDCHAAKRTKGHINLVRMSSDVPGHFKSWEKVIAALESKAMPPEDEEQPTAAQRQKLITGVRRVLDGFIRRNAGDPGRIVMRQLTSAEYGYTIQDLTGLELGLERSFLSESAGGEGFSNVGDVQFIQEATLERYLEAAKAVAAHAVIGAGPLQFYRDPGKTGQELSAIRRIQEIYRRHGFRTGAGEGGLAFGLDHYPRAFFAAWRFQHRRALGMDKKSLTHFAQEEGLEAAFVEHVWGVVNDGQSAFPTSEIVAVWRQLPVPAGRPTPASLARARTACEELYKILRGWQGTLAANSRNDEDAPVLSEHSFAPSLTNSFRALVGWPKGATHARVQISIITVAGRGSKGPTILWRTPRLRFRQMGAPSLGTRRVGGRPLHEIVLPETGGRLRFGQAPEGVKIAAGDFVTTGSVVLPIEFPVPPGAISATLFVETEMDLQNGDDCLVRCVVSAPVAEGSTAAATGMLSALLANPNGPEMPKWKAGAVEFARKLPQVSHAEPTPADRDPIPEPYDNSYSNPERNDFHSFIKYNRDDRFLAEHILDATHRARLDQAWVDLLTSFDYHDTFLRFVAKKYQIELGDRSIAKLSDEWISNLAVEARPHVQRLHTQYLAAQRALKTAEPGHLEDAMRFAQRAWRRPLTETERDRLRAFYTGRRAELDHGEALRALLARILVAPAFLYRLESPSLNLVASVRGVAQTSKSAVSRVSQPARESASIGTRDWRPLSDWELAGRLSYFLWSSLPDAELARAAAAGELRQPAQLTRQAQRMLRDPKARRLATELFGQWFGFYRFDDYRGVDTTRFTEFTGALKSSLYNEAISFFEHIARENRPVREILFADYAFLDDALALHYGIAAATPLTNGLERVEGVNQYRRGGLLRLGAVLTSTSAPLRTSAVKRGDWILRRVLGTPVPPPPGDAGSIPPDDALADGLTVRQRLEAHRRDTACVNCHSRIDPLGFALEHFDSLGRWRDTYRDGQKIDASGRLNDGTEITEFEGLEQYLRTHATSFERTLCSKLLGYALGRAELVSDRPLLQKMADSLRQDQRFAGLVEQIVTSTQFRFQRQETEGPYRLK